MSREMDPRRELVAKEAETWIRTPFHHEGRVKGAGVDCLMLLAEVYERVGVIPHAEAPHYPPDWHMHKDIERYLGGVTQYAREIEGPPEKGDMALFHFGRTFSHGAIVVEWPRVIHAWWGVQLVVWGDANIIPLKGRKMKFFTPFNDQL